jgi:hypothetical protein
VRDLKALRVKVQDGGEEIETDDLLFPNLGSLTCAAHTLQLAIKVKLICIKKC